MPLLLLLAPPIAMFIGAKFWVYPTASPNKTGTRLLTCLDLVTILSAIYFIYRAEGVRGLTASIVIAELWLYVVVDLFVTASVAASWP
jgi:hypothetical protein